MRWLLVLLFALPLLGDLITRLNGSALMILSGLGFIFCGERLFFDDPSRWAFTGSGFVIIGVAISLRLLAWKRNQGSRQHAHRAALLCSTLIAVGVALYGLSSDFIVTKLGFDTESALHWQVVFKTLSPIALLCGFLPLAMLDYALWNHPIQLPIGATRKIIQSGWMGALGISLLFPVNYLASSYKWEWELAYFKITAPGDGTIALARGLSEPVEVFLVFPPGSSTLERITPYFDQVQKETDGKMVVRPIDPAVDVALAEELGTKTDGFVVFRQGEVKESLKLDPDFERARRDLKKLDGEVQKRLWKVGKGPRTVYLYVGHGEAATSEKEDILRKLLSLKRALEGLNLKVKDFGIAEGSAEEVPDDADFIVVAAPTQPLLPEEEAAIYRYLDKGGRIAAFVEPGGDRMEPLLAHLGLKASSARIADARSMIAWKRGISDRGFILTNKFGNHEITKVVSKIPGAMLVFPETTLIEALPNATAAPTSLVSSMDTSWLDVDNNWTQGPLEPKGPFSVAWAASGPAKVADAPEWRAFVVGDVSFASDVVLSNRSNFTIPNRQFILDSVLWLMGEEAITGETNNEEDRKIAHTQEQDIAWFWGTIVVVPMLVLLVGAGISLRRGRMS